MGWILLLFLLALGGYAFFRLFDFPPSPQPFLPDPDDETGDDAFTPFSSDPPDPFSWDGEDDMDEA